MQERHEDRASNFEDEVEQSGDSLFASEPDLELHQIYERSRVWASHIEAYLESKKELDAHYSECIVLMKTQCDININAPDLSSEPVGDFHGDLKKEVFNATQELNEVSRLSQNRLKFLDESGEALTLYLKIISNHKGIYLPLNQISQNRLAIYLESSYSSNKKFFDGLYENYKIAASSFGLNRTNLHDQSSHLLNLIFGTAKSESAFNEDTTIEIIENKIREIHIEQEHYLKLAVLIDNQKKHLRALLDLRFEELKWQFEEVLNDIERYHDQLQDMLYHLNQYESLEQKLDYLGGKWKEHLRVSVDTIMRSQNQPYQTSGNALLDELESYAKVHLQSENHIEEWSILHDRLEILRSDCAELTSTIAVERLLLQSIQSLDNAYSSIPKEFFDNADRFKTMKTLERYLKEQFPRLPLDAERINHTLYRAAQEKSEQLQALYLILKGDYLKYKRQTILEECQVVDLTNNMSEVPKVLAQIKDFKSLSDVNSVSLHQLTFFENKLNCKISILNKERGVLYEISKRFFDSHKDIGGRFGFYLKQRSEQYRAADFFRDVIAYPLTLFGYQSDRHAREQYLYELRQALNRCILPNANMNIALAHLNDKIEYGRMHFKPRALDGNGYQASLHKYLSDFKSAIDPIIEENATLHEVSGALR